ncbi:hypothetical protein I4F81_006372 [Pyropia yezoensis]|uniref:Uncharacterized protein n=1 Tax=Pyropia yezoensis TaxID=2788 RepID=A0ACC3C1U0_PYRYE|nr:hypothetical protein I4F81_006372 [Neopyropia yezoensis]
MVQLLNGLGVDCDGDLNAGATAETAKLTAAAVADAEDTIDVDEVCVHDAVAPIAAAGDDNRSAQTMAWVDLYQVRAGIGATTGGRQLASWIRRFYGSCGPGSPTASGKTAAVYAVAAELGYSVLEVSAATIRSSGRGLLDRLAEATQSQRLARGPDVGAGAATAARVGGDVADSSSWATSARSLVLLDDAETLLADERLFWLVLDGLVRGGARRPVIFTVSSLDTDAGPVHRTLLRAAISGGGGSGDNFGATGDANGDGVGSFLVDDAAPASRRGLGSRVSRLAVALIHMARPPLAVASALLATAAAEQRALVSREAAISTGGGEGGAGVDVAASNMGDAAQLAAATGRDLRAAMNALQFWGLLHSGRSVPLVAACSASVAERALPPKAGACGPVDAAADSAAAAELVAWARHLDVLSETAAAAVVPPSASRLGFEAADVALLRDCAMVSSWGGLHGG